MVAAASTPPITGAALPAKPARALEFSATRPPPATKAVPAASKYLPSANSVPASASLATLPALLADRAAVVMAPPTVLNRPPTGVVESKSAAISVASEMAEVVWATPLRTSPFEKWSTAARAELTPCTADPARPLAARDFPALREALCPRLSAAWRLLYLSRFAPAARPTVLVSAAASLTMPSVRT